MISNVPVFLDTNVLIRFDILETPEHKQVREAVSALVQSNCLLWISRQVIREYCRVLTHPTFPHPLPMAAAVTRIRALLPYFFIADETSYVTHHFLQLLTTTQTSGKQVHDANIVASMQANGVHHLLTLNIDDYKRFSHLIALIELPTLP